MSENLLSTLKHYLDEEGMDSALLSGDAKGLTDRLIVYLGKDPKNEERILQITAQEQILPANFEKINELEVQEGFYRLQIQSEFPIKFESKHAASMASAVNFLNGMLELPGLLSDEVNDRVYYRCVEIVVKKSYKKMILMGVIGMHRLVLDLFTGLLEKIGTGEMTYYQLLEEIVEHTKK